jgi:hypothetical protein
MPFVFRTHHDYLFMAVGAIAVFTFSCQHSAALDFDQDALSDFFGIGWFNDGQGFRRAVTARGEGPAVLMRLA